MRLIAFSGWAGLKQIMANSGPSWAAEKQNVRPIFSYQNPVNLNDRPDNSRPAPNFFEDGFDSLYYIPGIRHQFAQRHMSALFLEFMSEHPHLFFTATGRNLAPVIQGKSNALEMQLEQAPLHS